MVEGKVFHIQAKTAIITDFEELVDVLDPCRLTVRGHTHHFILSLIYLEAQKCRECGIEESQRVGEFHFAKEFDPVLAMSIPVGRGFSYSRRGPFPNAV